MSVSGAQTKGAAGPRIKSLRGLQVLDSRGNPTVSAIVQLDDGSLGQATVPAGVSTGEYEAVEIRDGNSDYYFGRGVQIAVSHINKEIAAVLNGIEAHDQQLVDRTLCDLDGSPTKERLGANAILAVSLAVARAAAASEGRELFEYLGGSSALSMPVPLVNVINGGAHAQNGLDVQEFLLIPVGAERFSHAVRMCSETFQTLGALLHDDGYSTGVGDEGGYAPWIESVEDVFDYLLRAIERAGFLPGEEMALGVNVAASELVDESSNGVTYRLSGFPRHLFRASDLIDAYEDWASRYPIVLIEDGLGENDWNGWRELTVRMGSRVQVVGDDLFVTQVERIQRGISSEVANSVVIKPNQVGTLTETRQAIELAKKAAYSTVISHRSGDSADAFIADLAVAVGAGQIKAGSMCRGERIEKYNRLLWIEEILGDRAQMAAPFQRRI